MRQHSYKAEAIVLSRRNFGEADKILTVLTKHQGKLRAIAKGIRRPASRKRGSLELFNGVVIFLAKGRNLDIITEAQTKDSFSGWRKDLLRVGIAYHLVEVVNKLTREDQEVKRVYELLYSAFLRLETVDFWKIHELVVNFKKEILEDLGFMASGRSVGNLDSYIEELSQSKLRTIRFLRTLR